MFFNNFLSLNNWKDIARVVVFLVVVAIFWFGLVLGFSNCVWATACRFILIKTKQNKAKSLLSYLAPMHTFSFVIFKPCLIILSSQGKQKNLSFKHGITTKRTQICHYIIDILLFGYRKYISIQVALI